MAMPRFLLVFFIAVLLSACAANPVTGKQELNLLSIAEELAIGEQQYTPSLQSQGGEYIIDAELSTYVAVVGQRIAACSDRPDLPWEFTILNNAVPNAWALPGGKIAINRGLLLALDSEAELAAVLGHEIVHAAARHGAQKMEQGMLMGAGMQVFSVALREHDQRDLLLGSAAVGAQLIQSRYGRQQELESDAYGMEYMSKAGYDPSGAVELQQTFVELSVGQRHSSWQQLFASHPPSQERLHANVDRAATLPDGDIGREYYQQKTKNLREAQLAYQNQQQGQEALAKGDAKMALMRAQQAIKLLPMEAQLYHLKGASLQRLGQLQLALIAYDRAVALNGNYYNNVLSRALLNQQLGHKQAAREDFIASQHLLTTAVASVGLAQLALARNDQRSARQHYQLAAQSQGAVGEQARTELLRMDLAQSPHNYLIPGLFVNQAGYLSVRINNIAPIAVSDITVIVSDGRKQQYLQYAGTILPSQQSELIVSAIKLENGELNKYRASVSKARLAE